MDQSLQTFPGTTFLDTDQHHVAKIRWLGWQGAKFQQNHKMNLSVSFITSFFLQRRKSNSEEDEGEMLRISLFQSVGREVSGIRSAVMDYHQLAR